MCNLDFAVSKGIKQSLAVAPDSSHAFALFFSYLIYL